jgi:CDP-paratose 2-epimerase
MLEAIAVCEEICERPLTREYQPESRVGDHIWWISDISKFQAHYPEFRLHYDTEAILREIFELNRERWPAPARSAHA